MPQTARDLAHTARAAAPCAVELPAGCGKTELISWLARVSAESGERTLVLTHTNVGVDVLRRRLRRLGVQAGVSVRTIDSWSFDLVRRFPQLSGLAVGREPDWSLSESYHLGAARCVDAGAISRMLSLSYSSLIVDEYQDCSAGQHELVVAISNILTTVVFGDRLQGLFFFGSNSPVVWQRDVVSTFPPLDMPTQPHRWKGAPELGEWLIDARKALLTGGQLDFDSGPLDRFAVEDRVRACAKQPRTGAVVAIAPMEHQCRSLAARLNGRYTMIEEVEGRILVQLATVLDAAEGRRTASAVVEFAVDCALGPARALPADARRRIADGRALSTKPFRDAPALTRALEAVIEDPCAQKVLDVFHAMSALPGFRTYRREAWQDIQVALRFTSVTPDLSCRDAVARTRDRLRIHGRRHEQSIIARPLLVKGLEFDHAVVAVTSGMDAHELYVSLTRGSASVAVVSDDSVVSPVAPEKSRATQT